ncbi:solute carrier family 66 member 2 [Hypomesus transpacificus]|uniref:solute carrier family 66 member 2 n=1 Tax=Hypomesus transpacificus TaxID=137520 RepID=UPI001F085526|nr:solute carrier family 66 member 2 [Hypomesus transpacificus]XP_046897487.1 solute carrier family 66 member 2 [Hypomesus transpacificus]
MDNGQVGEEDGGSLWLFLGWVASCVMVFGSAVPYAPQYHQIQRTKNTEGFSTRVCLVLLVSNILRILFWFGKRFEVTLLLQSVVIIFTMLVMLHLCCCIQNSNRMSTKQHHITDLDPQFFWSWDGFEDYLIFLLAFTVPCSFITLILMDSALFVNALGSLAVMSEAMLGIPQLVQNQRNRSTLGMSINMVLLWMAGDCFKMAYFVLNESPFQFLLCGLAQILVDLCILFQSFFYNQETLDKLE